jgi:hypothetical protein
VNFGTVTGVRNSGLHAKIQGARRPGRGRAGTWLDLGCRGKKKKEQKKKVLNNDF